MSEIREMRVAAGLSRPDVFKKLGIPVRTQEDWEAGKKNPPEWVKEMVLEKLRKIKNEGKSYFGGAEIEYDGKIDRIPSIQFEQLFDMSIVGIASQVYIWAIPDDLDYPVRFRLVPDLKGYSEFIKPEEDEGLIMEIEEQGTDREDYLFFYATTYDEGEEERDELGDREYVDREYFATFLPGSNRKFGYAHFRTLIDAVTYLQAIGEDKGEWRDGKNNFSAEGLKNISNDCLKTYGSLTMELEKYCIFTEGGENIFWRD